MRTRNLVFVCVIGTLANAVPVLAQDVSTIVVPMSVSLGDIAVYANAPGRLPEVLHHREVPQTCAQPEQACTKIPEFRGLKVTFNNRCVEISPRIECTVTEDVRRSGPMRVSGKDGMIRLTQDILGTGTVRGRGEIGRHIQHTVRARAEFTIEARPSLSADWTPVMPVSLSYHWIDRPEFRLFNLFSVTVGGMIEPPLTEALRRYERETIPQEISKMDLRAEAERLWNALQTPHPFKIGEDQYFLHVTPLSVGLEGPVFDGGSLAARLAISAQLRIDSDGAASNSRAPLPDLVPPPQSGYRIVLPVTVPLHSLEAQLLLPAQFQIEGPVPAEIVVNEVNITATDDGRIKAVLEIDARPTSDVFGVLAYNGPVTVTARPVLDSSTAVIRFQDPELGIGTPDGPKRILDLAVGSGLFGDWLTSELSYDAGPEIRHAEKALNAALNQEIAPGLRLSGGGDLSLSEIKFGNSEITIYGHSEGGVRVEGFDPVLR